jgi:hypothetical protein
MTLEVIPGVSAGARFRHEAEVTFYGFQATDPDGFGSEIIKDGKPNLLQVPDRWFQQSFQLSDDAAVRIAKPHPSAKSTRDLKIAGPVLITVYNPSGEGKKENFWVTAPRSQTITDFASEFSASLDSKDFAGVTSKITSRGAADRQYLLYDVGNLVTVDVPTEISPLS